MPDSSTADGKPPPPPPVRRTAFVAAALIVALVVSTAPPGEAAEQLRTFRVLEGSPAGTAVGTVGGEDPSAKGPFLVVPQEGGSSDLTVDQDSGAIRTRTVLDREKTARYVYSAIPLGPGDNAVVKVVVDVVDVNDNSPEFRLSDDVRTDPPLLHIDIPENTPRGTKRRLPSAVDRDLGAFGVQRYDLLLDDDDASGRGQVTEAFNVSYFRESDDGPLVLDLVVVGDLDREARDLHTLRIVAVDGGEPPRTGTLTLHVHVQDLNDSPPIFSRQRYFTTLGGSGSGRARASPAAAVKPAGDPVLQVSASDADQGLNGHVSYLINRKQSSDRAEAFDIDQETGLVTLAKDLDLETAAVHEIVVVARDAGEVPQETSAFVTVRVSPDSAGRQLPPPHLTAARARKPALPPAKSEVDGGAELALELLRGAGVPENLAPGEIVGTWSLPRSPGFADVSQVEAVVTSRPNSMGLFANSSGFYLQVLNPLPDFDGGGGPAETFQVTAKFTSRLTGESSRKEFLVPLEDVNDHAPKFEREGPIEVTVNESLEPRSPVLTLKATDKDSGKNGQVEYSIQHLSGASSPFSDWFSVDKATGVVSTQAFLDCELESKPKLTVVATDKGDPALSASIEVIVNIVDVNDNQPLFEHAFYQAQVPEDMAPGTCFLTIKATDLDCGMNGRIKYSLLDGRTSGSAGNDGLATDGSSAGFTVNSSTGQVCLDRRGLDREKQPVHSILATATDTGGLSATSLISVEVLDVNDNAPKFQPSEYNFRLSRASDEALTGQPILKVRARDPDQGVNAEVRYLLEGPAGRSPFVLDPESGELSVAGNGVRSGAVQDQEYLMRIRAVDGGNMSSLEAAQVRILMTDDAALAIKPINEFSVTEDVSPYSEVGQVKLPDGFEVTSSGSSSPSAYLSINPTTGSIRTEARLDYELHPEILLNLEFRRRPSSSVSGDPDVLYSQAVVKVTDVNDNAPEFHDRTVTVSVPENFPVGGAPLYVCKATDADSGENGRLRYRLLSPGQLFSLDPETGVVSLAHPGLDYEEARSHTLTIEAEDSGVPRLKATMKLVVDVRDVNDHDPVFERGQYLFSVAENLPPGTVFGSVKATDSDEGKNGRVTYAVEPGSSGPADQSPVDVYPNSGLLVVNENLRTRSRDVLASSGKQQVGQQEPEIRLVVIATDQGVPPRSARVPVTITVVDRNDQSPRFNRDNYIFRIAENLPSGQVVGDVEATDDDFGPNGEVKYRFRTPTDTFAIDGASGRIVSKKALDREASPAYELVVEAVDKGSTTTRSSQTVIKILVEDVNDEAPYLVSPPTIAGDSAAILYVPVEASSSLDAVVGVLVAEDNDVGDVVSYELLDHRDMFKLDRWSGELRPLVSLGDHVGTNVSATLRLSDSAEPSPNTVELQLIVSIVPADLDGPWSQPGLSNGSALNFKVRWDDAAGTKVGTVPKMYPGDATFRMTGSKGSQEEQDILGSLFYLDALSGDLYLTDTPSLHRPDLLESDGDFSVLSFLAVSEWSDRNVAPVTKELRVRFADRHPDSDRSKEDWILRDPIHVQVPEDAPVGSEVYRFPVNNVANSSSSLIFSIFEQLPVGEAFVLDQTLSSDSSVLKLAKSLDYEEIRKHFVTVRIESSPGFEQAGTLSSSSLITVVVEVQDVNDLPPKVLSPQVDQVITVNLGHRLVSSDNVLITRVIASDPDNNGSPLSFGLADSSELIRIDETTGDLYLIVEQLDDGLASDKEVTIQAKVRVKDNGDPSLETLHPVKVKVVLDRQGGPGGAHVGGDGHLRKKTYYEASVKENSAPGEAVVQVGGLGETGFDLTLDQEGKFMIDRSTGLITTSTTLDREEQEFYLLVVSWRSSSGGRDDGNTAVVNVTVTDENDNDPNFGDSCRDLSLPEQAGPTRESVIHTFTAADPDRGPNGTVRYRLEEDATRPAAFAVDQVTGQFWLDSAGGLDREAREVHRLVVVATDSDPVAPRSSICQFEVVVLDENDNDPVFLQDGYSASVAEDLPLGTEVLRVAATDADAGRNANIRYSIENTTNLAFGIREDTGSVYVRQGLLLNRRDRSTEYIFDVRATDDGAKAVRSGTTKVTILVTDVNDHTPEFTQYPFRINVSATPPSGVPLLRLTATDEDHGPNGQLSFGLVRADQRSKFQLSPDHGILTVASSSSSWTPGTMELLEVTVSDAGSPPRTSTGLIQVSVDGPALVEGRLGFDQEVYYAEIPENLVNGSVVAEVKAVRTDGRRQDVAYSLVKKSQQQVDEEEDEELAAFEVGEADGIIRVLDQKALDYETTNKFVLTVAARSADADDDVDGAAAYATVVVSLKDVNDNAPMFSQDVYRAHVVEGLEKDSVVLTVTAFDLDRDVKDAAVRTGGGGQLVYEIIDGNVDGAFAMRTAQPGVLLTNTVLDREIRDTYELVVSASDGSLSGEAKVVVRILDVIDSPLQFPYLPPLRVGLDAPAGSYVGTVRANKIDVASSVFYRLEEDPATEGLFSLDGYSGQLFTLGKKDGHPAGPVDAVVVASDGVHGTTGKFRVLFEESGRTCRPRFGSDLYRFRLASSSDGGKNRTAPAGSSGSTVDPGGPAGEGATGSNNDLHRRPQRAVALPVGKVDFRPCSSTENVQLALVEEPNSQSPLTVSPNGTLFLTNGAGVDHQDRPVTFGIRATDKRTRKSSVAVVVIGHDEPEGEGLEGGHLGFLDLSDDDTVYLGKSNFVTTLRLNRPDPAQLRFQLSPSTRFDIDPVSGTIYKLFDEEEGLSEVTVSVFRLPDGPGSPLLTRNLKISAGSEPKDHHHQSDPVRFSEEDVRVELWSTSPLGTELPLCPIVNVSSSSSSAAPYVQIVSGNEGNYLGLDPNTGRLVVKKSLANSPSRVHVVLRTGPKSDFSFCKVVAQIRSAASDGGEGDGGVTVFPLPEVSVVVPENSPAGTLVLTPPVSFVGLGHLDGRRKTTYSLRPVNDGRRTPPVVGDLFKVDPVSGQIRTGGVPLDYEDGPPSYRFVLASSSDNRTEMQVNVIVGSVDEFPPEFASAFYTFAVDDIGLVSPDDETGGPTVIGEVFARDRDEGPDGMVTYSIKPPNPYFSVDPIRGVLTLRRPLDAGAFDGSGGGFNSGKIHLKVEARSRRASSLKNAASVTLTVSDSLLPLIQQRDGRGAGVPAWLQGVIVGLFLVILILVAGILLHFRRRSRRGLNKQPQTAPDPYLELAEAAKGLQQRDPGNRFPPPQYSEIVSSAPSSSSLPYGSPPGPIEAKVKASINSRSEMSEKSHRSASSGRGSVEDCDDEDADVEIRLINEGNYLAPRDEDDGGHDEDDVDDPSCLNYQHPDEGEGKGNPANAADTTTEEYLARLGIDVRRMPGASSSGTLGIGPGPSALGEDHYGGSIYNRIPDDNLSDKNSMFSGLSASKAAGMPTMGVYGSSRSAGLVGRIRHQHQQQPSVAGSLSSIVHSEEELAGSYNWDYLLDWGPQYQPLAHVFKEISMLRDDEYRSGSRRGAGFQGIFQRGVQQQPQPPMASSVKASSSPYNLMGGSSTANQAMSPNFNPALSPLAAKSPSVSPLGAAAPMPSDYHHHHNQQKTTI